MPNRENKMHEAFYEQIGADSYSQNMLLMGDFNHPNICWKDNAAVQQKSKRFLECVDDNFFQVVQETARKGAMQDVVFTQEEGLVNYMKLMGSLKVHRSMRSHEIPWRKFFHAEDGEALKQDDQEGCGCPIPGVIQGQAGCGSGQPGLMIGSPEHSRD